ncbi:MAG: chloride channel protein [Solirubrobacteraceae bacterium]
MDVSHQPNVPGRGIVASYGPRFWGLVAGIGVFAGLAGAALLALLKLVERLSWSFRTGTFVDAVAATSPARHVVVLLLAGLIAGGGTVLIARASRAGGGEISESLWLRSARLTLPASLSRGVLSIVTVGMGASLGREAAPQLAGAAAASRAADWAGLPQWQRRLLVACGAGAGMAAVYNVPLGGALFALEVLLGTVTLPLVLPALATTLIATATAWIALPDRPTYVVPAYGISTSLLIWAALAGPVAGLAAVGWVRLIARAHALRPTGRRMRVAAPVAVLGALGALSIAYPQLLGNGLDIVQRLAVGQLSIGLLLMLLVLKPLATAACLGSGSPGGLFTPTLACGVLFGDVLGHGWTAVFGGGASGSFALVGGGAMLAAAMQGPLAAVVMLLELTRTTTGLMVPMLLAVTGATVVARLLHAPSIYSARISDTAAERQCAVEAEWDTSRNAARAPVAV